MDGGRFFRFGIGHAEAAAVVALTCSDAVPIVPSVQHKLTQSLAIVFCLAAHVAAGSGAFVLCDGIDGHFALEPTHTTSGDHHDDHRKPCSDTSYDVVVIVNRRSDAAPIDFAVAPLMLATPDPLPLVVTTQTERRTLEPPPSRGCLAHLQTVVLLI